MSRLAEFVHRESLPVQTPALLDVDQTHYGRIAGLYPCYGKIATEDGRMLYFRRDRVIGQRSLRVGDAVGYEEELGEFGIEAHSVSVVRAQRLAG